MSQLNCEDYACELELMQGPVWMFWSGPWLCICPSQLLPFVAVCGVYIDLHRVYHRAPIGFNPVCDFFFKAWKVWGGVGHMEELG